MSSWSIPAVIISKSFHESNRWSWVQGILHYNLWSRHNPGAGRDWTSRWGLDAWVFSFISKPEVTTKRSPARSFQRLQTIVSSISLTGKFRPDERCYDFLTVTSLVSQKMSHPWLRGSQRTDEKTLSTFPSLSQQAHLASGFLLFTGLQILFICLAESLLMPGL